MALGVRKRFNTDIGLSITGIAGPTGDSKEKPIYDELSFSTKVEQTRA